MLLLFDVDVDVLPPSGGNIVVGRCLLGLLGGALMVIRIDGGALIVLAAGVGVAAKV